VSSRSLGREGGGGWKSSWRHQEQPQEQWIEKITVQRGNLSTTVLYYSEVAVCRGAASASKAVVDGYWRVGGISGVFCKWCDVDSRRGWQWMASSRENYVVSSRTVYLHPMFDHSKVYAVAGPWFI
jgi:hypothetical protein